MSQEGWGSLGNIANTTAITTAAYSGVQFVLAGYRYASPYTTLAESEKKLKRVKSRLQGLSPRRREEIETASQGKDDSKSLELLEEQLDDLVNMYCRLSKRCDEARFPERHNPYSEFRIQVSGLEQSAKALLNDTFKTTVPFLDDIKFDPKNLRSTKVGPSNSQSADASSAPLPGAGGAIAIQMAPL